MKLNDLKLTNDYLQLDKLFYHKVAPTPLENAQLLHANKNLALLLNIDEEELFGEKFLKILNGEERLQDFQPYAMCYAGHQFGYFVPRLGDGRAINIASIKSAAHATMHLQLKGAGETLYSRQGDGRAVLRSSIREYLMSEAMHALGIPSSRALALSTSTTKVARERYERGSMTLRVSSSWIRFGTFEYFARKRNQHHLVALADYVIKESYPELEGREDTYLQMFEKVVSRTASLMAKWQSVGFNHGVMNTDNMSIAGLTIDYGPYAFLDDYKRDYICNHTDRDGRYSFENQPLIGKWNLMALMHALAPIINIDAMQKVLEGYDTIYEKEFHRLMMLKLGLFERVEDDEKLLRWLLGSLESAQVDYTYFFRTLSHYEGKQSSILDIAILRTPLQEWLDAYDKRLLKESLSILQRQKRMLRINPKYVLKNYMLQNAIEKAENNDFSEVELLFKLAQNPFDEHEEYEYYAKETPHLFKNIQLSCSS